MLGTDGGTIDMLKSDIVGAAPKARVGLVYDGAKLDGSDIT